MLEDSCTQQLPLPRTPPLFPPQLRALQKEHERLQHALAARDHEIGALREIAEAAGQLQSQDTQAAKVGDGPGVSGPPAQ
jgi:hypothetical protein